MKLVKKIGFLLASLSLGSLAVFGCTQQRDFGQISNETQTQPNITEVQLETEASVPYVPTPENVVNQMLELAKVSNDDVLYDLGSGDGRIPITAAQKYNVRRGTGVELNPELVQESRANAESAGVSDRVEFLQQDLFKTDLSKATVVTLYLLPDVNLELRDKLLRELKPGTRIVSHDFDMGEWKPEQVVNVQSDTRQHTLYYWVVPEEIPDSIS